MRGFCAHGVCHGAVHAFRGTLLGGGGRALHTDLASPDECGQPLPANGTDFGGGLAGGAGAPCASRAGDHPWSCGRRVHRHPRRSHGGEVQPSTAADGGQPSLRRGLWSRTFAKRERCYTCCCVLFSPQRVRHARGCGFPYGTIQKEGALGALLCAAHHAHSASPRHAH